MTKLRPAVNSSIAWEGRWRGKEGDKGGLGAGWGGGEGSRGQRGPPSLFQSGVGAKKQTGVQCNILRKRTGWKYLFFICYPQMRKGWRDGWRVQVWGGGGGGGRRYGDRGCGKDWFGISSVAIFM